MPTRLEVAGPLHLSLGLLGISSGTFDGLDEVVDILLDVLRRPLHLEYNLVSMIPSRSTSFTFPMGIRMVPILSPFHSSVPCRRFMKPAMSSVTVPRRSEGMRPRGPRRRPRRGVIARRSCGVETNVVACIRPLTT